MTNDLLLAVLAMDAYNRTASSASIVGLVLPDGTMLGNAEVLSGGGGVMEDASTGFFAQAYRLDDGSKVISYRGTDQLIDALYGWPTALGFYKNAQAEEAAKFFQRVVAGGTDTSSLTLQDLYDANIELTGHSLGGGLAGLVGSLYGASDVRTFDNMAYESAALGAYNSGRPTEHFDPETGESLGFWVDDVETSNAYFLGAAPEQPDGGDVYSFQIQGQALDGMGAGSSQCPSSDNLRLIERFSKRGSGSSGFRV